MMPHSAADTRAILLDRLAERFAGRIGSILDVGAGRGDFLRMIRKRLVVGAAVGCEIHWPYMLEEPQRSGYDALVMGDIRRTLPLLETGSVDVVLAAGVLEHLAKNEAVALVEELRRIALAAVYVQTPIGPYPQGAVGGNPHEAHRSTWTLEDWDRLGFVLVGQGARGAVFEWIKE
jgi:SAM-dependent methyltransferase